MELGPTEIVTVFLVGKVLKESAGEVGGMIADKVRFWRLKQAVDLKEKTEAFLDQRGVTDTRSVPLKLTLAIVDGATIEEEDELHTLWARLLANALDPSFKPELRVAYVDILRSLTAFDARLLQEIYSVAATIHDGHVNLADIANRIGATKKQTFLSRDCLIRQHLIVLAPKILQPGQYVSHDGEGVKWVTPPAHQIGEWEHLVLLTQLGSAFVEALTIRSTP